LIFFLTHSVNIFEFQDLQTILSVQRGNSIQRNQNCWVQTGWCIIY